jgi:hypothetical protein
MKGRAAASVSERFEWMRHEILVVVGGNFFFNTPIAVQYLEQPVVWYRRDERGRMLLNLRMITVSSEPRLVLEDNDWLLLGSPVDFESPPSGKRIAAHYANGDALTIEFLDLDSGEAFERRYREHGLNQNMIDLLESRGIPYDKGPRRYPFSFPIAVCEITMKVGGTRLEFTPQNISFGGGGGMSGAMVTNAPIGLHLSENSWRLAPR